MTVVERVEAATRSLRNAAWAVAAIAVTGVAWYVFAAVRTQGVETVRVRDASTAPILVESAPPTTPPERGPLGLGKNRGGTGKAWVEEPRPLPPVVDPVTREQRPAPAECPAQINVWRAPDPKSREAFEKKFGVSLDEYDVLAARDLDRMPEGGAVAAVSKKGSRQVSLAVVTNPEKTLRFKRVFELAAGLRATDSPPSEKSPGMVKGFGLSMAVEPLQWRRANLRVQAAWDRYPGLKDKDRREIRADLVFRWGR